MNPVLTAFISALAIGAVFFILDLFVFGKSRNEDSSIGGTVLTTIITFFLVWLFNWAIFYGAMPALVGVLNGWFWIIVLDLTVAAIAFNINAYARRHTSLASTGSIVGICMLFVLAFFMASCTPGSDADAKKLASLVKIETMENGAYPDTDADHILMVPQEAADYKANQAMGKVTDQNGRNLSTIYTIESGTLQSVDNHLYWIYQLTLSNWQVSNQVTSIVPGYVVVDAEDPNAETQIKTGYKMQYTQNAYFDNRLEWYVYSHGYSNWQLDDPTLEVRDDWKPFFTIALCKPAQNFVGTIPQKLLIVDPESGEMNEYELDKVPDWVDRIYSQHVVSDLLSWWGQWGNAQWYLGGIGQTNVSRIKPSGDPRLVYTKGGHPSWQVTMTSWNKDTAAIAVVLFKSRSAEAEVYSISGITTTDNVITAFRSAGKNIRNFEPVHPSIHKIYGQLTWVVAYINRPSESDRTAVESFQAIGLMPALDVQGASVIMSTDKATAFSEYQQLIARGNSNASPEENSLNKTIQGVISRVATSVIGGDTNYFLFLDGDPHVFRGKIDTNVELPFAQPGTKVVIIYLDTGKNLVEIMSYDDLSLGNKK